MAQETQDAKAPSGNNAAKKDKPALDKPKQNAGASAKKNAGGQGKSKGSGNRNSNRRRGHGGGRGKGKGRGGQVDVTAKTKETAPEELKTYPMPESFQKLGLSDAVLQAVAEMGYTEPTPVQEQAIPLILAGRDVAAAAQTGTGKTAAFLLPGMDNLGHASNDQGPLCLIITPTRELAMQIDKVATVIARRTSHRALTVMGGSKYEPQIAALKRGVDVLVATPGRLLDLLQQKAVSLADVQLFVIDEADRMLDMGFWPDVRKIVARIPRSRQTLLFSATLSSDVMTSTGSLLTDPEFVEIAHKGTTASTIEQYIMPVLYSQKSDLLMAMLREKGTDRNLVFVRTKVRADALVRRLQKYDFNAKVIHADRSQQQRLKALEDFRSGKIDILVATDVLARGIDISDISHVYNYDVPANPEDYVHRIGRTGRAGEEGFAITFVGAEEIGELREIEYFTKQIIPTYDLPGFDYHEGRIVPNPKRSAKRASRAVFRGMSGRRGYRR